MRLRSEAPFRGRTFGLRPMFRLAATYLLLIGTILTGCRASDRESKQEDRLPNGNTMQTCLGRTFVDLPDGYRVLGRSQSMWHVEMSTLAMGEDSPDIRWEKRVEKLRSDERTGASVRPVEVAPGAQSIAYAPDAEDPDLVVLEAQKAFPDHLLRLKFEGLSNKEADIVRLLGSAVERYQPGSNVGFCIGFGAIAGKPSVNESALLSAERQESAIHLTIETRSAGSILSDDPLANIDEERAALRSNMTRLDVLRNEGRDAGGLEGAEGWIEVQEPRKDPLLRFTWFFPGVSGDSTRPEIRLKATAPAALRDILEADWTAILDSFSLQRSR